jgi:hypothetical protein
VPRSTAFLVVAGLSLITPEPGWRWSPATGRAPGSAGAADRCKRLHWHARLDGCVGRQDPLS